MEDKINEFDESTSEDKITEYVERIRNLSDEKIDELWFLCEFIIEDHEERFKALRNEDIQRIRESIDSAKEVVWNLLAETSIDEFEENLKELESA